MLILKLQFVLIFLLSVSASSFGKNKERKHQEACLKGNLSKQKRRALCEQKIKKELQDALVKDEYFLSTQVQITILKMIKSAKRSERISSSEDFKAFLKSQSQKLEKARERSLKKDSKIKKTLSNFYQKNFKKNNTYKKQSPFSVFKKRPRQLSDQEILTLIEKDKNFDLDELDKSTLWFIGHVHRKIFSKKSYFVETALNDIWNDYEGNEQASLINEAKLVDNLSKLKLKMSGKLLEIKNTIHSNYRCYCIEDYLQKENAQNISILNSCNVKNKDILDSFFIETLNDIVLSNKRNRRKFSSKYEDNLGPEIFLSHSKDRRSIQDKLNLPSKGNKERILEYYKSGLSPENNNCKTFTIVDKKNKVTSVYDLDGFPLFETNAIIANPSSGNNQVLFNPDSDLRKFEGRGYTRTTGAGIYYTKMNLSDELRKERKYDEEFNNRVLVLATEKNKDEEISNIDKEQKESILAIHAVPVGGYVSNASKRLKSFEQDAEDRLLSTGCVNLEGYAFDMLYGLSSHNCPLYVLPEDEGNYFHIKNGELRFSTSIDSRKKGKETAKKCLGSLKKVKNQKTNKVQMVCSGEWIDDPDGNINKYLYTPLSEEFSITDYRLNSNERSQVIENLLESKIDLVTKVTNKNIDEEDFSDLAALTYAITSKLNYNKDENQKSDFNKKVEIQIFKDLYNTYYKLKHGHAVSGLKPVNFDRLSYLEKRKMILKLYTDRVKLQKTVSKIHYVDPPFLQIDEIVTKSDELEFIHER